jgi:tetratricopeptide (TPR) repeat protein
VISEVSSKNGSTPVINRLSRLISLAATCTAILAAGFNGIPGSSAKAATDQPAAARSSKPLVAMASKSDALIAQLAGNNEKARSEARLLLPREDIEVVPKLVPLVASEQAAVWCGAFNVLADFAHQVSVPGREADQAKVAASIMTLVAPKQPESVKIRGLRLLPIAVPPGFDVGPMAALLNDATLREKTRAAFEEMGTPEANAALRGHLPEADPEFQVAILNSLARLQNDANTQAAVALTKSDSPIVRAAALRAIAWTGNVTFIKTAKGIVASADQASRSDAMDGILRLLTAAADRGGNWQAVVNTYLDILKTGQGMDKDGALAGLGRIGDGTCVGPVLDAIKDVEPHTWRAGIGALASMQGVDVTRAIVEAYPGLPQKTQLALIPVLGGKRHTLAGPALKQAAQSSDPVMRLAGLNALAESGLPEGLELLSAAAAKGNEEEKAAARAGLLNMADGLRAAGKKNEAGAAYLASFKAAAETDKETRRRAIEGIAACPIADAAETALTAAGDKELREPGMKALLGVGSALTAAGKKEKALGLYQTLTRMNPPLEVMREAAKGMAAAGAKVDLQGLLGTVTNWWVVGPFELGEQNKGWESAYIDEPNVNLAGRYMSGKQRVQWKQVASSDPNGKIDLRKQVANRDQCIGYAYTEITVKEALDAVLLVGVDDSEKIWVNGQKVFDHWVARAMQVDQDRVPVTLQAGTNKILLKIWQNTMGWEFCMRIARPDGSPVSFTQKTE